MKLIGYKAKKLEAREDTLKQYVSESHDTKVKGQSSSPQKAHLRWHLSLPSMILRSCTAKGLRPEKEAGHTDVHMYGWRDGWAALTEYNMTTSGPLAGDITKEASEFIPVPAQNSAIKTEISVEWTKALDLEQLLKLHDCILKLFKPWSQSS